MTETPPLAYFWGEDAFMIERAARTYAERLSPPSEPMEVFRASLDDDAGEEGGSASVAKRRAKALDGIEQHLGMAPLFGAGTLVVVRQPGQSLCSDRFDISRDQIVARMHFQEQSGVGTDRVRIITEAGSVGGSHFDQSGTCCLQNIRDAERPPDLDQFSPRDHDLSPLGQRG